MRDLNNLQYLFQKYLLEHSFVQAPFELYEPANYIMELGGKRLRPALLLMSYQVFDDSVEKALPAALAVEVFHNFSLVHDDIMDQAPLRRGKPTVHQKFGLNAGILSGDVMLIYSYEHLLRLGMPLHLPKILGVFNRLAIEVCEGQQYDMNFENRGDVQIEEYLRMIELKTAALIGGCMELGALVAGAGEDDVSHLGRFGRNIGVAFQLQDDILDTFGDPEKFGKKPGGDIVQNKKTYLILKAMQLADPARRARLKELMNTPTADETRKVQEVKDILIQLDIERLALEEKLRFQNKAFDHLAAVKAPEERKKPIRDFADQLFRREF
jgi:geranylgeranyl diphosphate synthase, type II